MTVATGVAKKVAFKKEASFNTISSTATSAGQYLRRVSSDIDLAKDGYESGEIRNDYQVADARHGIWKVGGTLRGELSPGAYSALLGSLLRDTPAVISPTAADTNLAVTIAAGAAPVYTLTRASGYFAKGYKVGTVTAISAGTGIAAGDIGKNLFIVDCTDTVMTVIPGGDGTLTATSGTAVAFTAIGKAVWTPESGHVDESYWIEHYYSDITKSELFSGCKIASASINLPATGISTIDISVIGASMNKDKNGLTWAGSSQFFSSPTAASTAGLLTAVSGKVRVGGVSYATVTGLSLTIDGGYSAAVAVGSDMSSDIFPGRVKVNGQMTAYFDSITLRDLFVNETSFEVAVVLYSTTDKNSKFMSFGMHNCKAMGATKSDGETGLQMTIPFVALMNTSPATDTTNDQLRTTIVIHDSDLA